MKWNWGNGIVLSFTVFCGLMIYMVIKSFQTDFYLVSEHYYAEELVYQDRIDEMTRVKAEGNQVVTDYRDGVVTFAIAADIQVTGEIHLYRPDNAGYDRKIPIESPTTRIEDSILVPGRYIAKISWYERSLKYYQEEEIFIN